MYSMRGFAHDALFQGVQSAVDIMLYTFDVESLRLQSTNDAFASALGSQTQSDLINASVWDVLEPQQSQNLNARLQTILSSKQSVPYEVQLQDGDKITVQRWVDMPILQPDSNRIIAIQCLGLDVTCSFTPAMLCGEPPVTSKINAQPRPDHLLRAQRLAKIGYWYWEPAADFVEWDEIYSEIMGIGSGKTQMTLAQCIATVSDTDQDAIRQILDDIISNEFADVQGMTYRIEVDNAIKHLQVHVDIERDDDGEILYVIGTAQDITEEQGRQEELRLMLAREQELNLLKTQFVSMVAHEFRNPLQILTSSLDSLERHKERLSTQQIHDRYNRMQAAVTDLQNLIDDIIFLRKMEFEEERIPFAPIDVRTLCADIVDNFTSFVGDNYQFQLNGCESLVIIEGNEFSLRRAIINLIDNAIKYSPNGGTISVDMLCERDCVTIQITDQGIGIQPDNMDNLFGMFYRGENVAQISGTGLGLHIVQKAVKSHNGQIFVSSTVGKGSRFTIQIPVTQQVTSTEPVAAGQSQSINS